MGRSSRIVMRVSCIGRTNIKQFTILYQGPKLWNSLPHSIIESYNVRSFKRLLNPI